MLFGTKHIIRGTFALALATMLLGGSSAWAKTSGAKKQKAANPLVKLEMTQIASLHGPKMQSQVIVTGVRKDGTKVDLTHKVRYQAANEKIAKAYPGGLILPKGNGETRVSARYNKLRASAPVKVVDFDKPFTWSFRNHVVSVFSKIGCNAGACHGASAGKSGFRLSLRGYDIETDHQRLLHEAGGRRIERSVPARSLILMKPSMAVPHGGGLVLRPNKRMYGVVSQWIASGIPGPSETDTRVTGLTIFPQQRTLYLGAEQQLQVIAYFDDGHMEDVTQWARYTSNEESILSVDVDGVVTTEGHGESSISIFYLDKVGFSTLAVPFPHNVSAQSYAAEPRVNYIDDLVLAKLAALKLKPSPLATDDEFCRRAYLDVTGTLPTSDTVRAFLVDKSPDKRTKLIDELLQRPEYTDFWTYKWSDLFRVNRQSLKEKGMWTFYNWIKDSVRENKPWDQMVHEVLTADGSTFTYGPANFYRMDRNPQDLGETASQAFLGIRVQCARCHNHPFEKWTQNNYYEMANFFARIGRKKGHIAEDEIIHASGSGNVNQPRLGKPLPPTPFDGEPMDINSTDDRRHYLAKWMTSPDNYYFKRAMINRIWDHYMGRGLVDPVDDLRATNPASNEPLLAALAEDFAKSGFDMKHMMRQILISRTYQRTSRPLPENKSDDRHYSRYRVKRLTAEQLLDAIGQVTGMPEKFGGLPAGTRAIQLPDTRVGSYFLDVFGRPARQITCACERTQEPNMAQALHLINGAGVNQKISAKGGIVDKMLEAKKTDAEIIEELYLTCFGRYPSPDESKAAQAAVTEGMEPPDEAAKDKDPKEKFDPVKARREVLEDLLWALINGKEFVFNH